MFYTDEVLDWRSFVMQVLQQRETYWLQQQAKSPSYNVGAQKKFRLKVHFEWRFAVTGSSFTASYEAISDAD